MHVTVSKYAALVGLVLTAAFTSGCPGKTNPPPPATIKCWDSTANKPKDGCDCEGKDENCSADTSKYICDAYNACQQICSGNADCTSPQICDLGQCVNPTCGSAADCSAGQLCIAGKCSAPPAPATCRIEPKRPYVTTGKHTQLMVTGLDTGGNASATLAGDWTWTVKTGTSVTVAAGGVVTGVSGGTSTVQAAHKTGTTCTVDVTGLGAGGDATHARVLVVDEQSGLPIVGAQVVSSDAASGALKENKATDSSGTATVDVSGGGTVVVSVFADSYEWISVAGATKHDLYFPLRRVIPEGASAIGGGFRGSYTDYNSDGTVKSSSVPASNLRLGIAGTSVPSSLIDLNLSVLVGPGIPTNIAIANKIFPVPSGIALGLGGDWYTGVTGEHPPGGSTSGDGQFAALGVPGECSDATGEAAATCGLRSAWALAGTVKTQDALDAFGNGSTSNLDIGSIVGKLLPYFEKFRSAVQTNIEFKLKSYVQVTDPTDPTKKLNLPQFKDNDAFPSKTATFADPNRFKRLSLNPYMKLPKLPQADVACTALPCKTGAALTADNYLQGALILAGTIVPQQGMVPLGLTAGVDKKDNKDTPDGVVNDAGTTTGAKGVLSLRLASPHSGVEGNPLLGVALALSFDSLGSSGGRLATSGLVRFWKDDEKITAKSTYEMGSAFLGFADNIAVDATTRAMDLSAASLPTGAVLRIRVQNSAGSWYLYYPAGATVKFPTPPAPLVDRLSNPADGSHPNPWVKILSQAMVLQTPTGTPISLDDLWEFNDTNADKLGYYMTSFSAIEMP